MMLMAFGFATSAEGGSMAQRKAVEATVTGNDQQVGFRALVMKQAIEYNLADRQERRKRNRSLYSARRQTADRLALATIQKGPRNV